MSPFTLWPHDLQRWWNRTAESMDTAYNAAQGGAWVRVGCAESALLTAICPWSWPLFDDSRYWVPAPRGDAS